MLQALLSLVGIPSRPICKNLQAARGAPTPKPRHACPFYGFSNDHGYYFDQHNNQCALIHDSYAECTMDNDDTTPDWRRCSKRSLFKPSEFRQLSRCVKVFPKEHIPAHAGAWKGMPLRAWHEYVMSKECPRPKKN